MISLEFKVTNIPSGLTSIILGILAIISGCCAPNDCSSRGSMSDNTNTYSNPVLCSQFNTEEYKSLDENPFLTVMSSPLSTFSIDVDAASYTNCRRIIDDGSLPPEGAVRIEEFINYFEYSYPQPQGDDPIGAHIEIAQCPWSSDHTLAKIGVKARDVSRECLPPANLTFLIDVSGSMAAENKLPLLKLAFEYLLKRLREEDKVAIVVYASEAGVALSPTSGVDKSKIANAIENLKAGGSTAGGAGINAAYSVAEQIYSETAINRVILATDGDFNVGVSSDEGLVNLIKQKRDKGIFLSVMGFGMGNYKDSKMEALADNGNGNYYYIDGPSEARRVFLREFGGTVFTVAKDVKIQVEFNPALIKAYRLIGYENRLLDNEDFNIDTTDAGEMGSGQTVTAFYELISSVSQETIPGTDSLRYQVQQQIPDTSHSNEFFYVKIRYKNPDNSTVMLITVPAGKECFTDSPSSDFLFASAVAEFGLLVRPSEFKGCASFQHVLSIAEENTGTDPEGRRSGFVALVKKACALTR